MTTSEFKGEFFKTITVKKGTVQEPAKNAGLRLGLSQRTVRKVRQYFEYSGTVWAGAFARASEHCGVSNA